MSSREVVDKLKGAALRVASRKVHQREAPFVLTLKQRVNVLAAALAVVAISAPPAYAAFHLEYEDDADPVRKVVFHDVTPTLNTMRTPNTPIARRPVQDRPLSGYSVQARIAAAWPGDDRWALATVKCETGGTFNTAAHNPNGHDGLWQFGSWAKNRDGMGDPRGQSVETQTKRAWALYQAAGKGQWECSPY